MQNIADPLLRTAGYAGAQWDNLREKKQSRKTDQHKGRDFLDG
ncbi:unnamed protein product, partial [marine sediment metagenome]